MKKNQVAFLVLLLFTGVEVFSVTPLYADLSTVTPSMIPNESVSFEIPAAMKMSGKIVEAHGDLYVATDPDEGRFVKIVERLPKGGFGRALRYRGWGENRRWLDLEFIYQDRENIVTILDYGSGRFLRTTLSIKNGRLFCLLPLNDEKDFSKDSSASLSSAPKIFWRNQKSIAPVLQEPQGVDSHKETFMGRSGWSKRLERGPPEEVELP